MGEDVDGTPRLSVIVPGFNAAATIERALGSVLDQHDVPLECVLVDDASTDGTADIAERIAAGDPRLRVVRLEVNGGVSEARNRALDEARGEWLAFLDADDRLRPGGLGAMLRAADAGDLLAVVGQRISTDGDRSWYPTLYEKDDIRRAGRKSVAANPDLLYYVGPAGKLIHRSCAQGLRFEGRMLGDQPWIVRALVRAGDRIGVIEDVVYEWWRPNAAHYVATITSAREDSAALGVGAVAMAAAAFDRASAAFAEAYDPATRSRLEGVYAGRLLRADLGGQLRSAIRRRDPHLADMLLALAALADRIPPAAVAGTDAMADSILEPVARHWADVPVPARKAFWVLLDAARRADPGVAHRTRSRPIGLLLRGAIVPIVGRPASSVVLHAGSAVAGVLATRRRPAPAR